MSGLQLYVPGSALIFVGRVGSTLRALGKTEERVEIEVVELTNPVRVSTTGPMVKFDSQIMGKEVRIRVPKLVYFDQDVMTDLLAYGTASGNPFEIGDNIIGTLKRQEGVGGFRCLVTNQYGLGAPGFHPSYANMLSCINIPVAELTGPQGTQFSTINQDWGLNIEALPVVTNSTGRMVFANFDKSGQPPVTYF